MLAAQMDETSITSLNDDSIYQILERMRLDDIGSLSRTCKRFRGLCDNHFRRKYPAEYTAEVEIAVDTVAGRLYIVPIENYVKYFRNFIQKLSICRRDSKWTKRIKSQHYQQVEFVRSLVVDFVTTKCHSNLKRITIQGGREPLELVPLCKGIENILGNVEEVEFVGRKSIGPDEAGFLQHCSNVQKLIVYNGNCEKYELFQKKYAHLTHFHYINGRWKDFSSTKLDNFFRMNINIQCVAWTVVVDAENGLQNAIEFIRSLNYARHLEHLFVSIERSGESKYRSLNHRNPNSVQPTPTLAVAGIFNYLKALCARDQFKALEMRFQGLTAKDCEQLNGFDKLAKVHTDFLELSKVKPAIHELAKSVVFRVRNYTKHYIYYFDYLLRDDDTVQLQWKSHTIEEVQIEYTQCNKKLSAHIQYFARFWTNLKRLLVPRPNRCPCTTKFDIAELNVAREQLENAVELTIFTNRPSNETNVAHRLVKLKYVDFDYDSYENPFQNSCMVQRNSD